MIDTLVALVPFADDALLKVILLGAGDASLAERLLTKFPNAMVTLLEHDESVRLQASRRLTPFADRLRVLPFELAALDWWDRMFGVDLVVSALHVGALSDAKKQYLYKAAADRMSPNGALLLADRLAPGQLLHHLVWLRHARFTLVDCFWRNGEVAVFGGLRPAAASTPPLPAGN